MNLLTDGVRGSFRIVGLHPAVTRKFYFVNRMINLFGKGRACTIGLVSICAVTALLYGLGSLTAEAEELSVRPHFFELMPNLCLSD